MIRKVLLNTGLYGLAPQIPKFAGLIILPLISQNLTAKDFGFYGIILAYTQAFLYLKTLGTDVVLSNSFFKHPKTYRVYWRHINGLLHFWAVILSVVLGVILLVVLKDEPYAQEIALLNCLPVALFSTTENLYFRFYQLQQKPLPISVRIVITGLINVVITYYTIHILGMGYRGWFYASFVASAVGFLLMIYPIYIREKFLPVLKMRWTYLKRSLLISLPVLPHFYGAYLLNSSDRVMLDLMNVSTANVGRYNAAGMIGNFATIISSATNKAIGPMLQLYQSKNLLSHLRQLVFLWQILFLIGTTMFSIWLKEIIPFFIKTKDIGELHGLAIWVVMAVNYVPMYGGANTQIFFKEKTAQLWKRAFMAFGLNVVLNLIFVPLFGIYAAAVNTFITYMFLGYSSYWLKAYTEIKSVELYPVRWFALTLILTAGALLAVELHWTYKAIITGLLLVGLCLLLLRLMKLRKENDNLKNKASV